MHLSSKITLDLIDGRLGGDKETFWQQHLEVCRECAHEFDRWRQLKTDLKRSHLKSAPEGMLNKVFEFFPQADENQASRLSVVASIVYDTFRDPAVAYARGAVAGRQLVMTAEEFDIHIKIWGEPDRRQMLGQLLPRGTTKFVGTARFHLLQNGERLETATLDEMGEFSFTDLPEGDLSIQIDLPNLTVVGALNVGERQ